MSEKAHRNQYLAALILNLLSISFGGSCGWVSPAVLELSSKSDPVLSSGPITSSDASWIGSVVAIGATMGTLLFGMLIDRIGRKATLLIMAVPLTLSWVLIVFAEDVITLCISRVICGIGAGGIFLVIPLFIQEIADDKIRGALASSIVLSSNLGILAMFILADYVSFRIYSGAFLVFPVAFFFLVLFFLPETPARLLALGRLKEAENSLQFYNNDKTYRLATNMKRNNTSDTGSDVSGDDTKEQNSVQVKSSSLWQDLKLRSVRKAFLIGTVMMWFNQFCGLFTMLTFAGSIFQEAGSSLSPNTSAIVVAVIQLLGSYTSTLCVDRFGRKILLAGGGFGISLGLGGLGLYILCKVDLQMDMDGLSWISLVCFCFSIFIGYCGIMSLPFVIVSEIFPKRISKVASTYCMILINTLAFTVIKVFPVASESFGPQNCFFFFSICSLAGALFSIFGMPETKGISIDEIEMMMCK